MTPDCGCLAVILLDATFGSGVLARDVAALAGPLPAGPLPAGEGAGEATGDAAALAAEVSGREPVLSFVGGALSGVTTSFV